MIISILIGAGLVLVPSLIYCLMPGRHYAGYGANRIGVQSPEAREVSQMLKQHMFNSTFGIYHSGDRHVSNQIQRPHDWDNTGSSGPFA